MKDRETVDNDRNTPAFTCPECGSHKLTYKHRYTVTTRYVETLFCRCEEHEGEPAARLKSHVTNQLLEWGYLDDDLAFEPEATDDQGEVEADEDDRIVDCGECCADADEDDWDLTQEDPEVDEKSHDYRLTCAQCGHEIEFAWLGERGESGLWLVDDAVFDPALCTPEPRYVGVWEERGWA